MAKPVILAIDDDPMVLSAVDRDLRKKYGQDYRIVPINMGSAAMQYLKQLQGRAEVVALFLVDQRMPQMSGVEFLEQARHVYPEAKKVLLTAYADTEAAINSINKVSLDYYLMKPWDPPEERLYPVLDELLGEWKAHVRMPYEGIRLAGTLWSSASHNSRDFLTRNLIPYQWLDVEKDAKVRALVEEYNQGELRIPTLFFPDGSVMVEPNLRELAEKVGLKTRASLPYYDLIIIGSGPAGLSAAVYASSEGLSTLAIERGTPGGQAGSSPKIDNYLGFPNGISGNELARRAMTQARRLGAEILTAQEVTHISLQDPYRIVRLSDNTEISSRAVLLATGASFHMLRMPGAAALSGAGVYYGAAYTEARSYKDQDVFVVGGANSAAQGALYLSRFARKVNLIVRGELSAAQYLADELRQNEKIDIYLNTDLIDVRGEGKLEEIVVKNNRTDELQTLKGAAMFVFIGVRPQSQFVADLVARAEKGYVLTGPDLLVEGKRPSNWPLDRDPYLLETSVPGIFAAGDVRYGTTHRVSAATSEGGLAVALIRQYLKTI
ncbi:MAG TPA: FAD-dependent oxidoreductase [Anaerolineales bacterium]